jgi:hypothetical protein
VLTVGLEQYFLLDVVFGLITTDPGGSGTNRWWLLRVSIFDGVLTLVEKNLEILGGSN